MLAYVFWHYRRAEVEAAAYERALLQFHKVLNTHKPEGFFASQVHRLREAPWMETDLGVYEDWYFVRDFAAFDVLNVAAVARPRKGDHDHVARYAAVGKGGVYRLQTGEAAPSPVQGAYWFAKPEGTAYPDLMASLQPLISRDDITLWGRQMNLGPTPEFCLQAPQALDLPVPIACHLDIECLWMC